MIPLMVMMFTTQITNLLHYKSLKNTCRVKMFTPGQCFVSLVTLAIEFFFVYFWIYILNRQMVARGLLDTLRAVEEMDEEVFPVFNAMVKLSQDSGKLTDWLLRNHFFSWQPMFLNYGNFTSSIGFKFVGNWSVGT